MPRFRGNFALRLRVGAAALLLLCGLAPAWASLGGDASSVQADQVRMQASRRVVSSDAYTVHEMQAPTGTVVKEYLSPGGKVFAVSWHGPWMPDMRQLLGSYFEQYTQAAQSARTENGIRIARQPLVIEQPGLVVQVGGHSRSFAGVAYVPEMLPSGMRAEDIQ